MIDIVSIFCRRDAEAQLLQATSIARFFERSELGTVVYVYNDDGEPRDGFFKAIQKLLPAEKLRLINHHELAVAADLVQQDGWVTQQVLKLEAARLTTSSRYLVLDAKNHFIRPSGESDFIAPTGRIRAQFVDSSEVQPLYAARRYFALDPHGGVAFDGVTPFVFDRFHVLQLLAHLGSQGLSLSDLFFRNQHTFTEFSLYQAFLEHSHVRVQDLYEDAPPLNVTFWADVVRDPVRFSESVTRCGSGQTKMLAVHWASANFLTDEQAETIAAIWLRAGLISEARDGQRILEWCRGNYSRGDLAFVSNLAAQALVSVIVPVHNKEVFLRDCLTSVLQQSLKSLEVICVDDVSTDGSLRILEEFAASDPRVRLIRQRTRQGPGEARNVGLRVARGRYVQFTDADDILPKDALRQLVARAEEDSAAAVRGGIEGFRSEAPHENHVLSIPGDKSNFPPLSDPAFWIPWWHTTYLFSRDFLQKARISYPALWAGEDPVFLARVLTRLSRLSTISAVVYRYRMAPLDDKGRTTFMHLRDYLQQAEMVKELFESSAPHAWHEGFAPTLRPEIERWIAEWPLEASQREEALQKLSRIFDVRPAAPKVLFLYHSCGLGGVETSIRNKIAALGRSGTEGRALFERYWGDGGRTMTREDHRLQVEENPEQRQLLTRSWSPDVVIVVDAPWLLAEAFKASAGPVLFETHCSDLAVIGERVLPGALDPRVSAVIVPSIFNRDVLITFGVHQDRIFVINNPVDTELFSPLHSDARFLSQYGIPAGCPVVLFVGRLEPQKNPLEFLRIAKALNARSATTWFLVVGSPFGQAEHTALVHQEALTVSNRIVFVEHVPFSSMPMLYSAVAASGGCLISTSTMESVPMVVVEAMACECPVVASDVGGMRELIADGSSGHLYRPGDVDAAVRAAHGLMTDKPRRNSIVDVAAAHARASHAPDRTADAYRELFHHVRAIEPKRQGKRLRVIALVSAFNEEDIISCVIRGLVEEGIQVYLLDNHSTDGTREEASIWLGRGLLKIELFPPSGPSDSFDWTAILKRKEQLARELDADWFIHHDADEFRESPWPGIPLRDGLEIVDGLGYNCVDFRLLNFRPVDDGFKRGDDPRAYFPLYEEGADYDRLQLKCWKRQTGNVSLAESGGHDVRFPGRKTFPVRFLLRHYPIRGQRHAVKKVFAERLNRVKVTERSLGWHVQYDSYADPSHSFLWSPAELTAFDGGRVRQELNLDGVEKLLPEERQRLEDRGIKLPDGPHIEVAFDEKWYLGLYPDVAEAVAAGQFGGSAQQHYLLHGRSEGRLPSQPSEDEFDEKWYLATYPDVAAAVKAGHFEGSALKHYLTCGRKEGRFPTPPRRNST